VTNILPAWASPSQHRRRQFSHQLDAGFVIPGNSPIMLGKAARPARRLRLRRPVQQKSVSAGASAAKTFARPLARVLAPG
jgi:hypothetical protein